MSSIEDGLKVNFVPVPEHEYRVYRIDVDEVKVELTCLRIRNLVEIVSFNTEVEAFEFINNYYRPRELVVLRVFV